jgi:predicted RNA-binding Zn-ribbon protein involved in translation (DUF1610 family)
MISFTDNPPRQEWMPFVAPLRRTGTGSKGKQMASTKDKKEPRCPYCVSDKKFRVMKVLENGRQICERCGHIIFPHDTAFRCPCPKCLEVQLSPRIRDLNRP